MTKRKTIIFILSIIILPNFINAQVTRISSPYSRFELGNMKNNYYVGNFGMAGIGLGYRNNDCVNHLNPASYSAIDSLSFIYEAGISGYISDVKTWNTKQQSRYFSLSGLSFAFPINKYYFASFGLLPYSSVGYKVNNLRTDNIVGDINYKYEGDGGLNQIYIGNALKINKYLSFGFNANYLFGYINKTSSINFVDLNFISMTNTKSLKFSNVLWDFGMQYLTPFSSNKVFTIGATITLPENLNATQDIKTTTFKENNTSYYPKDTIENILNHRVKVKMPLLLGAGFTIQENEKWLLGFDYSFQQWTKFSIDGVSESQNDNHQVSLGGEYTPSKQSNNYLKKITYQLGIRYNLSNITLKDKRINSYGYSFGFAFPMRRSKSMINTSFELGQRGTTANSLIKEQYFIINLSFSLYEKWFMKRKFE
jgi:hypothetical protein